MKYPWSSVDIKVSITGLHFAIRTTKGGLPFDQPLVQYGGFRWSILGFRGGWPVGVTCLPVPFL